MTDRSNDSDQGPGWRPNWSERILVLMFFFHLFPSIFLKHIEECGIFPLEEKDWQKSSRPACRNPSIQPPTGFFQGWRSCRTQVDFFWKHERHVFIVFFVAAHKKITYHGHVTFFLEFCWCTHVFHFFSRQVLANFRLWVPHLQFEFKRRSFAASSSSSCPSYLQDFFVEFGWIWQKDHNLLSFRRSMWNPKSRHFARLAALVDFVKDIASKWCEAHEKSPNYGNLLDFETFNLYHATFWVIEPATLDYWKEGCSGSCSGCGCGSCGSCASCNGCSPCGSCGRCGGCSYVELVAISTDDQRPKWFVSHAWLEPIVRFMRCLKQHALVRQLSPQSAYWVCASKKTRDDRPQREVLVRFGGVLLLVGW